jgi:hypothetical protein
MFHHKRNKDLDFDGHGERIEKLQAAKVGHGATASFDAYKRRTLCCGGGVNDVRAVHPVDHGDEGGGGDTHQDEQKLRQTKFDESWGFMEDQRKRNKEANSHHCDNTKSHAMATFQTRLHQNPGDIGTSMDGVSAETFFKQRPQQKVARRHSILRGIAQAKANTRIAARRVSGVFSPSKRADARRADMTRTRGRW